MKAVGAGSGWSQPTQLICPVPLNQMEQFLFLMCVHSEQEHGDVGTRCRVKSL